MSCFEYAHYGYPDYPDGALRSNVVNFSRFLRAMMQGGALDGARVLNQASVSAALSNHFINSDGEQQGLVWVARPEGNEWLWGHTGSDYGASTQVFFRQSDGVGVMLFANGHYSGSSALHPIRARLFQEASAL